MAKGGTLPMRITAFKGENWGFLSNFSPCKVKLFVVNSTSEMLRDVVAEDPRYPEDSACAATEYQPEVVVEEYESVEHAYQAAKFLDPKRRESFRLPGLSPSQAKAFAGFHKKEVRGDWIPDVSLRIMKGLLKQKFTYSILRRKLLGTFKAELIEGNWWHDNFFGDCHCDYCSEIKGQNWLGKLLMEIRDGSIR
jgi:predicted NAD-dependent protein-ADP-ribosyltransferase YbiA (DUF1768 family)